MNPLKIDPKNGLPFPKFDPQKLTPPQNNTPLHKNKLWAAFELMNFCEQHLMNFCEQILMNFWEQILMNFWEQILMNFWEQIFDELLRADFWWTYESRFLMNFCRADFDGTFVSRFFCSSSYFLALFSSPNSEKLGSMYFRAIFPLAPTLSTGLFLLFPNSFKAMKK